MNESRDTRVPRLLSAIAALLAAMLLGSTVAVAMAWRGMSDLRREVASHGDAVAEIATRQQQASKGLAAMVTDARRQLAQFEDRAAELRKRGNGPLETPARMVELQQLMADQMMLALKQSTALQDVLAKTVRPLGDTDDATTEPQQPRVHQARPAPVARRADAAPASR